MKDVGGIELVTARQWSQLQLSIWYKEEHRWWVVPCSMVREHYLILLSVPVDVLEDNRQVADIAVHLVARHGESWHRLEA